MRIVLFYSETDSFNFGTDQLAHILHSKGHEVFILDLLGPPAEDPHSYAHFVQFLSEKVDLVITFDGMGIRDDLLIEIWDSHQAVVADILLDPPLRFHPVLVKHPKAYLLFCCDMEHVEYVKKYFASTVPYVSFMPHFGVMPEKDAVVIPYKERKYDVLFTGTYYRYQDKLLEIEETFPKGSDMYRIYRQMFDNLVCDCSLSIEQALLYTLEQFGWSVSEEAVKTMLRCAVSIDWAIRTWQRERVITALAESGQEIYLLGKGWENCSAIHRSNVHRVDGWVTYGQTLLVTADAKIRLNVMPWFKAGTHDRIFNALLQHSLPLTDSSTWLTEHFTDGVDLAMYDLKELERLPDIVSRWLGDETRAEEVIQRGYEKVRRSFTWADCVEQIMETIRRTPVMNQGVIIKRSDK